MDPTQSAVAAITGADTAPTRARGHGEECESVDTYRGTTVEMEPVDEVCLDIGVSVGWVDRAVDAVRSATDTGEVGDGKIFVLPIERVVRIRTGERDEAAVTPTVAVG